MESHGGAIFHIGPIGVTSAMVTMSAITLGLCLFAILSTRHLTERPGKAQNVAEKVVEMLLNFLTGIIGRENARAFLPFLGTMFLFILISNYSGILPWLAAFPDWLRQPLRFPSPQRWRPALSFTPIMLASSGMVNTISSILPSRSSSCSRFC